MLEENGRIMDNTTGDTKMNQQVELSDFEKRLERLAHVRALIMKIIHARPGLTYEEIGKQILLNHGFLPRIGNRVRELRKIGWVETREGPDKRLHVYPRET